MMLAISRKIRFEVLSQVTSWDVTALCCILNLFRLCIRFYCCRKRLRFLPRSYNRRFMADWERQMVLGDVLFCPHEAGHLAVILTLNEGSFEQFGWMLC